jgi:hypothetical protein
MLPCRVRDIIKQWYPGWNRLKAPRCSARDESGISHGTSFFWQTGAGPFSIHPDPLTLKQPETIAMLILVC